MARTERPLDDDAGPVARFAADLRLLRAQAGGPAYRELARLAHYSAASLSEAASGRKLPSLAVTLAYVSACGGDIDTWERRWHDLAAELTPTVPADSVRPPYVGLAAFQPADADRFFGRERVVDTLVDKVARRRFVVVVGPSGSGKSSLLRAGLLPRRQSHTVVMTPGPHPLEECAARLATGVASSLHAALRSDPRTLHLTALQALADHPDDVDLLVVVDQFEEVFTVGGDPAERTQFITALATAANAPNSRTRVVLGVRADFYTHCARYPELVEALRDGQVLVGPMSTEELREAVTKPALLTGCRVENALVSQVIADATGQPGVLPLISHALLETWRRRRGNTLTLTGYTEAGGIGEAVARTAESVYTALSEDQQRWVRHLFTRLVALGEGTEDTKRRIHHDELDAAGPDETEVLDKLTDARLITLDRDTVEITHEALVRCWPRLRGWLTDDRDGLRTHRQLTEAAGIWEALHRDSGALYRGNRLSQAESWAEGDVQLTTKEREFLTASRQARAREEATVRRRARRMRQFVAMLVVLLVATTVATVSAFNARTVAEDQRNQAVALRALSQAAALRAEDPALAVQLSLAAYRMTDSPEARDSLLNMFTTPYAVRLTGHTDLLQQVTFSPDGTLLATASNDSTVQLWQTSAGHAVELATLTGFTGLIRSVAFSPDGRTLAATGRANKDHTAVRLWDIADPRRPRALPDPPLSDGSVQSNVLFSRDGRLLIASGATKDGHGAVWLWDITTASQPRQLRLIPVTGPMVYQLALGPGGRTLISAEVANTLTAPEQSVRVWDIDDTGHVNQLSTLDGYLGGVASMEFSPDGRTLATTQGQDTVRLWDLTDPQHPQPLNPIIGLVGASAIAFSRDGHTLAVGGTDRITRLWDVTDVRHPQILTTLAGYGAAVQTLSFSPDGRTLAIGGTADYVRLEDVNAFAFPARAHGTVYAVAFGTENLLAAANIDGTVSLWDTTDPWAARPVTTLSRGPSPATTNVAFSPQGDALVTADLGGTVTWWDLGDRRDYDAVRPVTISENSILTGIGSLAFSPDGRTLVGGTLDGRVLIWDATNRQQLELAATLTGFAAGVQALAFGGTGHLLATAADNTTTRLWDLTDLRHPRRMATPSIPADGLVTGLSISPDSRTLAIANPDRTVSLFDITDPGHARPLSVLSTGSRPGDLTYANSGRILAAGYVDGSVALWDVADPTRPHLLTTLTTTYLPRTLTFSPNGHLLASANPAQSMPGTPPALLETNPDRVANHICDIAVPRITPAVWNRYFPGIPFQPPCP